MYIYIQTVHTHTHIYIYIRMYACMHVCVYIYNLSTSIPRSPPLHQLLHPEGLADRSLARQVGAAASQAAGGVTAGAGGGFNLRPGAEGGHEKWRNWDIFEYIWDIPTVI